MLLILDGWGRREDAVREHDPAKPGRRISTASGRLFPHAVLDSFGEAVGMPPGTVGNSEAGHLHLGAGRRVLLDRVKIDKAIEDGSFFRNEAFALGDGTRPGDRPGPPPHGHRLALQLARDDRPSLRPPAHGPGRRA